MLFLLCAGWGAGAILCRAQDNPKTKLLFLIARPSIEDPLFAKSVVLMLELKGEPLIVGLIVNKPTRVTLLKLFPDSPLLQGRSDTAFMGGPVDPESPALVFHAPKPHKQAMLLYDDVYLTFDPRFIANLMKDPKQSGDVRLYMGRAQWAPEQLQGEALEGSWYSLRAEGDVLFDRDTKHLWDRLHERAQPPSSVENRGAKPAPQTLRAALLN